MNKIKNIFCNIFRLNNSTFTFLSGIFVSAIVNIYTSLIFSNEIADKYSIYLSMAAMLIVSILWLVMAVILQPLQDLFKRTPSDVLESMGADNVWSDIISPHLRKISIMLVLCIALSVISIALTLIKVSTVQKESSIKVGDYYKIGNYNDEPILWRCVDIDDYGPLMLADKILCLKPFDAAGSHIYIDGTIQGDDIYNYRNSYGSNLWETSSLRAWLNSTASAGNIVWIDKCPPAEVYVWNGYNDYANEKGFLVDDNFSANEKNLIKSVSQKSLLNSIDAGKLKTGGVIMHIYNGLISSVEQNYDTAFYHNVTDKMFLLDVKQLSKIYQNRNVLGTNYYIGKLTEKAVKDSEIKESGLLPEKSWFTWIRNLDCSNGKDVRIISFDGSMNYCDSAYTGRIGIRPAFYLNMLALTSIIGKGTEISPYTVTGVVQSNKH